MCGHSFLQVSSRITDINFTGLTISHGTYILVYDMTYPWIIERIVFDKKVAELPIFSAGEYFDR